MTPVHEAARQRAAAYAQARRITLAEKLLGFGYDGVVFRTDADTAIKALAHRKLYEQERDVYLRLHEYKCREACGLSVPQLVQFDNEFLVVEMTIVSRPCVLDFAAAALDFPPPQPSEEEYREWDEANAELFGGNWPTVRLVLAEFRSMRIHLLDVHPRNIQF